MLRALHIQNIVLVEEARLEFSEGLTILSGETGAGKSAVLKALGLILGERADAKLLRKGASKGQVEALFSIEKLPALQRLLDEAGIPVEEELLIRRELQDGGKSRAFVNHSLAHISLLQQIATHLIDLVGQHANQRLSSLPYHRMAVDMFGSCTDEREAFRKAFQAARTLQKKLEQLDASEAERLRERATCERELAELDEAQLDDPDEENLLDQEQTRLANAEELLTAVGEVVSGLESSNIHRLKNRLEEQPDPVLAPQIEGMQTACAEIDEVVLNLRSYKQGLQINPGRLGELNDRLRLLMELKRKYGTSIEEMLAYREELRKKVEELSSTDEAIEKLQKELQEAEVVANETADVLSEKRQKAAAMLEEALLSHLYPLNMKGARFEIQVTKEGRTENGDDRIEFHFSANPGEELLPVKQCASGGELSRLLLALKTTLAGLERTPTLILDEIDANIGGKTAALVGENLKAIAQGRQVISITHLPQVAQLADHHFSIAKQVSGGRTVTTIAPLTSEERQTELSRMLGGLDQIALVK